MDMENWAKIAEQSIEIAVILALAGVVYYLYKGKEKLQTKHTDDLVKATAALQDLTAEYLKQSFIDSKSWQERLSKFEDVFAKHSSDDLACNQRTEAQLTGLRIDLEKHEARIKEHVDLAVERILR